MNEETNPRIAQAANAWSEHHPVKHQLDMIDAREALFWEMVDYVRFAEKCDERYLGLLHVRAEDILQKLRSL